MWHFQNPDCVTPKLALISLCPTKALVQHQDRGILSLPSLAGQQHSGMGSLSGSQVLFGSQGSFLFLGHAQP